MTMRRCVMPTIDPERLVMLLLIGFLFYTLGRGPQN